MVLEVVKQRIERYFEFDLHGTTFSRELRGIVTFLTMSYIC